MLPKTTYVYLSKCCGKVAIEDFRENFLDHDDPIEIYTCSKCRQECQVEDEPVCDNCLGTGEVSTEERVYPDEPHMADIGTIKCYCQLDEDDGEPSDDYQEEPNAHA